MSKENKEMVTIEVPVAVAENMTLGSTCGEFRYVQDQFRKVLAARKSLYEQWKESRCLPWVDNQIIKGDIECTGADGKRVSLRFPATRNGAMLIAAAPLLLEAAIWAWLGHRQAEPGYSLHTVEKAIRAALPEDVANEVLGE